MLRVLMLGVLLSMGGCSWLPNIGGLGYRAVGHGTETEKLIATDLVLALVQLKEWQNDSLVIEAPMLIGDEFAAHAIDRLRAAGYEVRQMPAPDPSRSLQFASEARSTLYSVTHRYFLGIGNVAVEREYSERNGGIYPRSAMQVVGSASDVELDDEIFQRQDWRQTFPTGSEKSVTPLLVVERQTEPEFNVVSRMSLDKPSLFNAYQIDKSNYEDFLEQRTMIYKDIVVFPNDSTRLTRGGKTQISNLLELFDPSSDWVAITGCSHGATALVNGNEELAKGRVVQVAQQLYTFGVSPNNVLAEGCWSPVHFDERGHPRRGVMMFIYRSNEPVARVVE